MKSCKTIFVFGLILLGVAFVETARASDEVIQRTGATEEAKIINEVLKMSGMKQWLDSASSRMDRYLEGIKEISMADKTDLETIDKIKNEVYVSKKLNEYYYASLRKYYKPKRFTKYIQFFKTPLRKKIMERRQVVEQMSEEELKREAELFGQQMPSQERLQLVLQLLSVTNVLMIENVGVTYIRVPMLKIMDPTLPSENIREELTVLIDQFGYGFRGTIDGLLPNEGFYCRHFSDLELETFIGDMSDPDIQYVHAAIYQALVEALAIMRKEFLYQVKSSIQENNESDMAKKYGALSEKDKLANKRRQAFALLAQNNQESTMRAIGLLEQLIFLDPNDESLCRVIGLTYQTNRFQLGRAVILLTKAMQIKKELPQVPFAIGTIYKDWREWDNAEEMYKLTLKMDPKAPGVIFELAYVYYKKGQQDLTIETLKKSIQDDPEYYYAHAMLGLILEEQGKTDSAKKYLDEARRLGLDSYNLGKFKEYMKK